jgi:hypothetical protein
MENAIAHEQQECHRWVGLPTNVHIGIGTLLLQPASSKFPMSAHPLSTPSGLFSPFHHRRQLWPRGKEEILFDVSLINYLKLIIVLPIAKITYLFV